MLPGVTGEGEMMDRKAWSLRSQVKEGVGCEEIHISTFSLSPLVFPVLARDPKVFGIS